MRTTVPDVPDPVRPDRPGVCDGAIGPPERGVASADASASAPGPASDGGSVPNHTAPATGASETSPTPDRHP
jgi:hypothetical protein